MVLDYESYCTKDKKKKIKSSDFIKQTIIMKTYKAAEERDTKIKMLFCTSPHKAVLL
jgi:hypothetical protein